MDSGAHLPSIFSLLMPAEHLKALLCQARGDTNSWCKQWDRKSKCKQESTFLFASLSFGFFSFSDGFSYPKLSWHLSHDTLMPLVQASDLRDASC